MDDWTEWQINKSESEENLVRENGQVDTVVSCHICGGKLVEIRGKHPKEEKRKVCPTCLADRMDTINQMSDSNYGKSYQEKEGN